MYLSISKLNCSSIVTLVAKLTKIVSVSIYLKPSNCLIFVSGDINFMISVKTSKKFLFL